MRFRRDANRVLGLLACTQTDSLIPVSDDVLSGANSRGKRPSEFTDEELELRIQQGLPGSIIYDHCVEERRRRQLDSLKKPHWSITPGFWVAVVAAIFAAIAAWPVIRDWIRSFQSQ